MKTHIAAFLFVACVTLGGCAFGADSVSELTSSPGYHKTITADYGYQEALKIIKDAHAEMMGYDLSCTVYSDKQRGECTATNMTGIGLFVTTEYLSETSSKVDFYAAHAPYSIGRRKLAYYESKLVR